MDHALESLKRIFTSGEYRCRPHRQAFVEHILYDQNGQIKRQVGKADLEQIAATGNRLAQTGDLAVIALGHSYDDVYEDGKLVRKFAESEQPPPIGYMHNYTVEQRPVDGKWTLYVDEWIKAVLNDEKGNPVDGIKYAETFPRRSPEYYPGKKWIDWLALLRRTPALNMGLDIYAFARQFPEKTVYVRGTDGASLGAVVDARGKYRYSEDAMPDPVLKYGENEPKPPGAPPSSAAPAAPAAPPAPPASSSPAAPPDAAAPAVPAEPEGLPPEHAEAAERYAMHALGMHHSRAKHLMGHLHAKYAAECGMSGEPHTPFTMTTQHHIDQPATPEPHQPSVPPVHDIRKPEHQQHAAGPGVGPAFIPGEEHRRMSAAQSDIQAHRYEAEVADLKARFAAQEQQLAELRTNEAKAVYERELTLRLARGVELTLPKEMDRAAKWSYAKDRCEDQLRIIDENYPKAPVGHGEFIQTAPGVVPTFVPTKNETPGGVSREEHRAAVKYSQQHECTFDEALVKIRGA